MTNLNEEALDTGIKAYVQWGASELLAGREPSLKDLFRKFLEAYLQALPEPRIISWDGDYIITTTGVYKATKPTEQEG